MSHQRGRDFLLSATTNLCKALATPRRNPANTVVFDGLPHAFWTYIDARRKQTTRSKLMANFLLVRLGLKESRARVADAPSGAIASQTTDGAAARCEALKNEQLPDTTITAAQAVPAGPFKSAFMFAAAQVPAHCRVAGRISPEPGSDIEFEVWMPLSDWNGRLYGSGNGGFGGAISYSPGPVEAVQHGAAGVSTDTGHSASSPSAAEDGSWAQGHPGASERLRIPCRPSGDEKRAGARVSLLWQARPAQLLCILL